jgi:hypothetical protein
MAVAEEAEASQRPRRPRGRPRWESSTDHERSSSHDSVHDNDLQHTVDGDGGPQTYDKEADPATVDEEVILATKDEEAAMVGVPLPLVR